MPQAVLFDLDGTLADTARDLGLALNRLLDEHALPRVAYEAIRPLASHGARGLISLGFAIAPDHPDMPQLRQRFLELYDLHFDETTVLFPEVAELIRALDARGIAWGIVTNKPMHFTDRLVPRLDFPSVPAVVISGDSTPAPKPDPRPMLLACERLGIEPQQCLYVGDAERDMQAGNCVGMTTVLAQWGYIAASDQPQNWGAHHSITHPLALLNWC